MSPKKVTQLVGSIAICFLAGGIGSIFTTPNIPTWYASLSKPFFNPPNWLFGPVWSILYLQMGVALYLVWTSKTKHKLPALRYFFAQLALNTIWSIIFFGLKAPLGAFVVILILWTLIFMSIRTFFQISKIAAYLLIPYIAWVSFATILNFSIVLLN